MSWPMLKAVENHTFLPPAMGAGVIIDIGANVGRFSTIMSAEYSCRCYAFEPDPTLCATIPPSALIEVREAAVGASAGWGYFVASDNPEAGRLCSDELETGVAVRVENLEDFAASEGIDRIALVKMDAEGSEIAILDSISDTFLASVGQFTIEFHDFVGLVHPSDVRRVLSRFQALGWMVIKFSRRGHGDVLAVNLRHYSIGPFRRSWLRFIAPWMLGLCRYVGRKARTLSKASAPRAGVSAQL